jgi:hypothetical protein
MIESRSASIAILLSAFALGVLGGGCGDDTKPQPWSLVASGLDEALLSISGTATDDVWAVGADQGQGPLVLHYDGDQWSRMQTGHRGHLWWVHALAPDDVFMAGASGGILRWDGERFTRMGTPGLGRQTVYGIWGSAPDRVYAVGSFAGRAGFIWRWDGIRWRALQLPAGIALGPSGDWPGLFKVWGDSAGRVWAVGGRGLVLRSDDGETFEMVSSGSVDSTLFTVTGDGDRVIIVGGASNGTVLEGHAGGELAPRAPQHTPLLQGVAVAGDQAWASGAMGVLMRREGEAWVEVDHGLPLEVQSLHAVWIDPRGGVWSVGGDVLDSSLDAGTIIHRGHPVRAYEPAPPDVPASPTCAADDVDPAGPSHSIARRWNELLLDAIPRADQRERPRRGADHRDQLRGVSRARAPLRLLPRSEGGGGGVASVLPRLHAPARP